MYSQISFHKEIPGTSETALLFVCGFVTDLVSNSEGTG